MSLKHFLPSNFSIIKNCVWLSEPYKRYHYPFTNIMSLFYINPMYIRIINH